MYMYNVEGSQYIHVIHKNMYCKYMYIHNYTLHNECIIFCKFYFQYKTKI